MTNQPVVDLITTSLPALMHPGADGGEPFAIPLPTFRIASIPAEMAAQFAQDAGLPSADIARWTAEAIVALIESGHEIVTRGEIAALREAAAATTEHRHKVVTFRCHCGHAHHKARLQVSGYGTDHPTLHMPALIKATVGINPDCAAS